MSVPQPSPQRYAAVRPSVLHDEDVPHLAPVDLDRRAAREVRAALGLVREAALDLPVVPLLDVDPHGLEVLLGLRVLDREAGLHLDRGLALLEALADLRQDLVRDRAEPVD